MRLTWLQRCSTVVVTALTDYTVLLVVLAGALGVALPHQGAQLQGALLPLLAVMVIGVGVSETPRTILGRPSELLTAFGVVAVQLTLLPLAAYSLSRALPPGDVRSGLLVVGLAPAEVTSALATLLAKGAAGFALRILALSLVVSTVSIPLWLAQLTALRGGVSSGDLFVELLLAVVVPLLGASLLRVTVPRVARAEQTWAALSALAVVVLIFIVAGGLRELPTGGTLYTLGVALAAFVLLCYLLGLLGGHLLRLSASTRRAVLFTTGMREFGVAAAVATAAVSTQAGAVAAVYGVAMMSVSFLLVGRLRQTAPPA